MSQSFHFISLHLQQHICPLTTSALQPAPRLAFARANLLLSFLNSPPWSASLHHHVAAAALGLFRQPPLSTFRRFAFVGRSAFSRRQWQYLSGFQSTVRFHITTPLSSHPTYDFSCHSLLKQRFVRFRSLFWWRSGIRLNNITYAYIHALADCLQLKQKLFNVSVQQSLTGCLTDWLSSLLFLIT